MPTITSSFFMVGEGWKRSLNLSLDHTDRSQRLHGFNTLELLNSHEDPTFARVFLYSRIARRYIPVAKVNWVRLVIGGESWGIYVNRQPFDKDFLKEHFGTKKGIRLRMSANPGGGRGLGDLGENPEDYKRRYKLRTKDGEKAWPALARLCRTLESTPPEGLEEALDPLLDIDGALWFLALDNVLINDDGYWIRSSDFGLYLDRRGRFHLIPGDFNETFREPGGPGFGRGARVRGVELDPLFGADDPEKPLLHRLLAVPALRARYLAHVRTIAEEDLEWKRLGPAVEKLQGLLDGEVRADTRKLASYEAFKKGAGEDMEEEGFRGPRREISLKRFVEERRKYLLGHPEVAKPAPRLRSLALEVHRRDAVLPGDPTAEEPVTVIALAAGEVPPEKVLLHYSAAREAPFQAVEMARSGGGRFTATIPHLPAGTRVRCYAEARAPSAGTSSFLPSEAESGALTYRVKGED